MRLLRSRPGMSFVVVVLRHECGGTTAHVYPDGEELAVLMQQRRDGVKVQLQSRPTPGVLGR